MRVVDPSADSKQQLHCINVPLAIRLNLTQLRLLV
jgi:hypothetical protein